MGSNDVSAPGRAIEAGSGRSRGCERRARRRRSGTRLTRTARIGRARLGVEKTPGEDVRDWSRGKDARAFSPGGSEIRRLRDLTSKSRACVRACASASGPPHGPTPHALATGSFSRLLNATKIFSTRDPHWPRRGFYPRFTDSAPRALAKFWIGTVTAGRYFGRNPAGTKGIQRPGKEIRISPRRDLRDIVPRAEAEGRSES